MNITQPSENTLLILFEQRIDVQIAAKVAVLTDRLQAEFSVVLIDVVPSYCSVHLMFDLRKTSAAVLISRIEKIAQTVSAASSHVDGHLASHVGVEKAGKPEKPTRQIIEIPVYYAEQVGMDLAELASKASLSIEAVIKRHSQQVYDVYALGFAPGFAYMGMVDESIATPRKQTPRQSVPAGSVGIAGKQTAIYPDESPGGWQIIGRTPIQLLDLDQSQPSLLKVGDCVQFKPINQSEFLALGGKL